MSTSSALGSVALYSPAWPPGSRASGIVSYVGNLVEGLERQGRRAGVIAAELADPAAAAEGCLCLADSSPSRRRRLAERLANRLPILHGCRIPLLAMRIADGIERLRADGACDLFEMEESFGTARLVRDLAGIPVVVRLHGPWFLNGAALGLAEDSAFRRRDAVERRAILEADGLTAPSSDVLEAVRKRYGESLPWARVIPNAAPVIAEGSRWTLAGSDKRTVLFVGRFDRHKGGDVVIDAFNRIARDCPESRLVFVGPDRGIRIGSGAAFDLRGYIEDRASPEAKARIEVRGPLGSAEIEPLRRSSHVTVMASRYENFSMALLEALAFGCPAVATDVGGNPEILADGKTGLLCRGGDPDSLAARVVELLREPRRAAELGRAAALDMAARLSPDRVASLTWEYYEKVWERAGSAGGRRAPGTASPTLRIIKRVL